jgi:hypothetical protein
MGSHGQQRRRFARRAMVLTGQAVGKQPIAGAVELRSIAGEVFHLGDTGIKRT